jgi:hypothetical protein
MPLRPEQGFGSRLLAGLAFEGLVCRLQIKLSARASAN